MSAIPTDVVLAQEALAIRPDTSDPLLVRLAQGDDAPSGLRDPKLGVAGEADDVAKCAESAQHQQRLYQALNRLDRAALCLSGGGIRSAAFSLGVIQALATHPRPRGVRQMFKDHADPQAATPPDPGQPDPQNTVAEPKRSLLAQFDYLSTVSGGGYMGSWLSAWRQRTDFTTVWRNLVGRPCGPDIEPVTTAWLRAYSNYLSPKVGILSADAWSGVAIYLRNLVLNWIVILPVLLVTLLILKGLTVFSVGVAHLEGDRCRYVTPILLGLTAIFLAAALRFTTRYRPTHRQDRPYAGHPQGATQEQFLRGDFLWALLSAVTMTLWISSNCGLEVLDHHPGWRVILVGAAGGLVIYFIGWVIARPPQWQRGDLFYWSVSGLVYGALVGGAAYFYNQAPRDGFVLFNDLLLPLLFGVPFVLAAQLIAEMIFVGLSSYQRNSDTDREWLGRAAGWILVAAIAWFLVTFLTFAGSALVADLAYHFKTWIAPMGGISGALTAWMGSSSLSPANGQEKEKGAWPITTNLILAVSAPLFAAALIITASAVLDDILFGNSLVILLRTSVAHLGLSEWAAMLMRIFAGLVVVASVELVASLTVNVNRFSLHAVYRNRLIRAFLGASSPKRSPDAFTGFDPWDNLHMHQLWPAGSDPREDRRANWRPFHVINMALNIVSTRQLAWQERKAETFTVSALHSGSACQAFRPSDKYGDPSGITLGTAMAISGAAASPNMGYHSSPAVTFLLALFNVRLGWWLGNPGPEGDKTYTHEGPDFSVWWLLLETFGLTTSTKRYVYLSDGGHFENLGLYEMVRRRCRFVVVVDAGADPDYAFEDLGNAVRKIYLDLGVTIRFRGLSELKKRPADGSPVGRGHPYHAVGEIDYRAADGGGERGVILYIKAGYHGVESAGVRAYAIAHPTFPHESTADQFFSESQFESYRSLGFEITDGLLNKALRELGHPTDAGLSEICGWLVDEAIRTEPPA